MAVNYSALQAVDWCNPSTSCYGFCCSIAIIASGDGSQMVCVIMFVQVKHEMFTYTLNGVCICSATLGKKLGAIACYEDFVLVAEGSRVRIRSLTR